MKIMKGDGVSYSDNPVPAGAGSIPRSIVAIAACLAMFPVFAQAPDAVPEPYSPTARPADAPAIAEFVPAADFQQRAGYGIVAPMPPLVFIKDQGAWYNPFFYPGMHNGYDIRAWHSRADNIQAKAAVEQTQQAKGADHGQ